ncbi:MAG: 2-hydroxyacid dehydrogenase [Ardenticatenaceae bacterium]|nr:2-hydroxyacid dehydrogenase [Ardenticatenaceae bacterium]
MATYTIVQLDPAPLDDEVVVQRLRAIHSYLADFRIGDEDRFVFRVPQSRGDVMALEKEIGSMVPEADFLLTLRESVTAQLLQRAKRLRLIQKLGLRYEVVDVKAAAEKGIPVAVSPHYGLVAVAEHTLALMLALSRQLIEMHRVAIAAENPRNLKPIYTTQWQRYFNWVGFSGDKFTTLFGKTLGVVGLGEIATEVVRRARAFEMRVLYTKRQRLPVATETELGVTFVPLDDLLQASDYVSLHVQHTPETEKLISERELRLMKPSAFLINTSRGNVVDEAALIRALHAGQIAGAGLDVFSVEPLQSGSPLLQLENVVLTPHVGAAGSQIARYTRAFENMKRLVEGKEPWDIVSPGYD